MKSYDIYAKPATENTEPKFIASARSYLVIEMKINDLRKKGYDGEVYCGRFKIGEFFNNEEFDISDLDI